MLTVENPTVHMSGITGHDPIIISVVRVEDEQHSHDSHPKTIHSLEGDSMKTRIALLTFVERGYRQGCGLED